MQLVLKTTAILLLFVQYFHSASLQESTDPPRRTIDSTWYRDPAKNKAGGQNDLSGGTTEYGQGPGETNMEAGIDYSSGIASGSMAYEQEEAVTMGDPANQPSENTTTNETTQQPDTAVYTTALPTDLDQMNLTDADKDFQNSTMTATTMIPETSTAHVNPQSSSTEFQSTTSAPESNTIQQATVEPDTGLSNDTGITTTAAVTTRAAAETTASSSVSSTSTAFPSETKETMPATTTAAPSTSEKANVSDKGSGQSSSSERGLASDSQSSQRKGAWGAVLGTAVAVACVGLVVYVILKKKQHKAFSHRKLVEEFPSDPVLRLDNSEPLDLNFGGSAYYNPALQGDSIQMTNFPGRHKN